MIFQCEGNGKKASLENVVSEMSAFANGNFATHQKLEHLKFLFSIFNQPKRHDTTEI